MEASESPLEEEETVCQLCGSKEWPHAFVFCVKCLKFAIHRYCLPVIPETFTEFVRWYCVDCEDGKLCPSKKPSSGLTLRHHGLRSELRESDRIVDDSLPSMKKAKKSKKSMSKKKKMLVRPVTVVNVTQGSKDQSSPSREPDRENNEKLVSDDGKLFKASADVARLTPDSQIVPAGPSTVPEDSFVRAQPLTPDSQIVSAGPSTVPEDRYVHAQPLVDPIWSGSFNIETDGYGSCDGFVAHLSSKACEKVWQEAALFSRSLCMDLLPKTSVWPKSFEKSDPSDDSIALYFFASNRSCTKLFDGLVSEMMSKELALKAVVTNAELLVFTSNELPISHWKFEGKFYLWGVFREKQAPLLNSTNCQLTIQAVENGDYNNTNKALDATSPISPLSNVSSSVPSGLRWTTPDAGELKLNVDSLVMPETKQGAIGGLIRDKDGLWVHGFIMYLGRNPETAALCAILKGLQIAWNLGIRKLIVESTSEEAIEDVASGRSDHPLYHYIEVIRMLMDRDWSCRIKRVCQEANTCARMLTREAFNATSNELAEPPEFMLSFLAYDRA